MMKKTYAVLIAVWSVIAIILIGVLVSFISTESKHGSFNWSFVWSFDKPDETQTHTIDKSFNLSDIDEINISSQNADINFTQSQDDLIKVNIPKSDGNKINVSQDGSTLNIDQHRNSFFTVFYITNRSTINIAVPEKYEKDISINSKSGDISLNGNYTFSKAFINKASGDLMADSITADTFSMKTASGDADISNLSAEYDIDSASGDITVESLSGNGDLRMVSGNLNVDIAKLDGELKIETVSGESNIDFAKDVNAEISTGSVSGEVKSDFDMNFSGKNGSGTIGNSPYQKVKISTVSGDINLTQKS
jgi:lia operon protein LiaG